MYSLSQRYHKYSGRNDSYLLAHNLNLFNMLQYVELSIKNYLAKKNGEKSANEIIKNKAEFHNVHHGLYFAHVDPKHYLRYTIFYKEKNKGYIYNSDKIHKVITLDISQCPNIRPIQYTRDSEFEYQDEFDLVLNELSELCAIAEERLS